MFVVPNGVDVQRFRPDEDIRGTDTSSDRGKVIVFVKALTEQSGVGHLVQSLPMVRERHPGTRSLLIGTGPLAAEIDDMIDPASRGRWNAQEGCPTNASPNG